MRPSPQQPERERDVPSARLLGLNAKDFGYFTPKFLDFTRSYAGFNKDNRLTHREIRSAGGVRVLRFEF